MLTRRDLRIKAFQAVYAFKQRVKTNQELSLIFIDEYFAPDLNSSAKQDVQLLKKKTEYAKKIFLESRLDSTSLQAESDTDILNAIQGAEEFLKKKNTDERKEILELSVKDLAKLEEAYVSSLQFLVELSKVKAKKDGAWIPNRLEQNFYINALAKSLELSAQVAKYSVNWDDEDQLPRQIYLDKLIHLEIIEEMNKLAETDKDFDFKVIKKIIKKGLFKVKAIRQVFDENDSYWNENEDIIERNIVGTLRKINSEKVDLHLLQGEHWDADKEFFVKLIESGTEFGNDVEKIYLENLKNWDRDKLTDADDAIVTLALNEMSEFPNIPVKVSMNEYIEITKKYSTPKSHTFVNGLIDSVSSVMIDKRVIRKSGRGLLDNQ